jgi:hypothetical protein
MKKQINEIKRMQQLAGLIKEETDAYGLERTDVYNSLLSIIEKIGGNTVDELFRPENMEEIRHIIDILKVDREGWMYLS